MENSNQKPQFLNLENINVGQDLSEIIGNNYPENVRQSLKRIATLYEPLVEEAHRLADKSLSENPQLLARMYLQILKKIAKDTDENSGGILKSKQKTVLVSTILAYVKDVRKVPYAYACVDYIKECGTDEEREMLEKADIAGTEEPSIEDMVTSLKEGSKEIVTEWKNLVIMNKPIVKMMLQLCSDTDDEVKVMIYSSLITSIYQVITTKVSTTITKDDKEIPVTYKLVGTLLEDCGANPLYVKMAVTELESEE